MFDSLSHVSKLALKSQKAKGIKLLLEKAPSELTQVLSCTFVFQGGLTDELPDDIFPIFARPCPSIPRHGFVDSRVVNNKTDLNKICEEIVKANEPIEILLSPFMEADWSAIATPETVSIGESNDGATSGKSGFFPTKVPLDRFIGAAKIDGHPYVEFVNSPDYGLQVVQLREGPVPPTNKNFIPEDITVNNILTANDEDLLEWEAKCKNLPQGTVIFLNGKSMTSHYAVHGVQNNIPVVSDPVYLGQKLTQNASGPTTSDYNRLAFYLTKTLQNPDQLEAKEEILIAMTGVHHLGLWTDLTEAQAKYLGAAIPGLVRVSTSLALGEMRHFNGMVNSELPEQLKALNLGKASGRNQIYKKAQKYSYSKIMEILPYVVHGFRDFKWGHSYGGMKWSIGTELALKIMIATTSFLHNPSKETWQAVATNANRLAYAVHNGGRFHNKVIGQDKMDLIAAYPGTFLLDKHTHKILHNQYSNDVCRPKMTATLLLKSLPSSMPFTPVDETKFDSLLATPKKNKPNVVTLEAPASWPTQTSGPKIPLTDEVVKNLNSLIISAQMKPNLSPLKYYVQIKAKEMQSVFKLVYPKDYGFAVGVEFQQEDYEVLNKVLSLNEKTHSFSSHTPYFTIKEFKFCKDSALIKLETPSQYATFEVSYISQG